ncbi:MAG: SDR family oxidoreductase [Rubrivivax sp.]|nr:SDR family oxidoreductase [Rubrivivax sp.]
MAPHADPPRRALVTGSSSGIGAAVAARLLSEGWQVHGLDRTEATLAHPGFTTHRLDLTDHIATREAVARLHDAAPLQALVHAAGLLRTAPLGALRDHAEDAAAMWQLHVDTATLLADLLLPPMVRAGRGRAVFIGSRVWRGLAGRSQYAATKAALLSLARSWAAEVVHTGVTVNVVSPAATDTPMLADPARSSSAPRLPPIGRLIRPAEVAALVSFLLGPDAAAITGQDIAVCGGASLPR